MEVKEINKSLLSLLQMKDNTQSGMPGKVNFENFLTEFEKISIASPSFEKEFDFAKEAASSNFSKINKNTFSEKNVKVDNSKKTEIKDTSEKNNKVEDKTSIKREDAKNENVENNKPEQDNPKSEQDNFKENDAGEGKIVKNERNEPLQTEGTSIDVEQNTEMNADDAKVKQEVSLDVLALLSSVTIVNPVSGEQVQVSGAELADQFSAQKITSVELSGNLENQPIVVIPDEQTPTSSAFQEVLQSLTPVSDAVEMQSVGAEIPQSGDDAMLDMVENADILETQSAQLSETVKQHKLKVEVNVKQENFADKVDGSLLKENKLSESVLSTIMKEGGNSNPLTETSSIVPNLSQNIQSGNSANLVQNKLAGGMIVQNGNFASMADDVVMTQPEGNSSTLVQAGSLGHESLSNAKVAANDSQNTSFRDVYKGMGKEVIDQVKVNITKSAVKGIDKVDIQLKPEDLGHIEVKMQIGKDGKLQAHIIASRPETAEILQKDVASLQKAFNEAGFQTDEGSLSFSFRNEGQSGQERNNLRSFIGQALEQETTVDVLNDTSYNGNWTGVGGLNIRV